MSSAALPGGPDDRYLTTPMTVDLAANTALSFSTTTTWQAYGGETTLRYFVQVVGLAAQNFLAGAAGLAAGVAFIRGFARERSTTLGNFWVDVVRATLWVMLPLSLVGSLVLVWQGVPLNLSPYVAVHTLEGREQVIAQGPVAALEFIKNLGTNGGGFYQRQWCTPVREPDAARQLSRPPGDRSPARVVPDHFRRDGRAARAPAGRCSLSWSCFSSPASWSATSPSARYRRGLAGLGLSGGNMEGKEVRFGVGGSVLAAVVTSNGATGSYNSMHDSFRPLGLLVPLVNMLLGEVTFGGLGTGLYSIVMVALVGIFMAGLMIGRTPVVPGQDHQDHRGQADRVVYPADAAGRFVADGLGALRKGGPGGPDYQRLLARVYRGHVCLRVVHGQQRPDHGGTLREQLLLQCDDRDRHGGGTVRPGRSGAGAGRPVRRPGPRTRNDRLDAVRHAHLWRFGPRHGGPGGRAVLPAGTGSRAGRRRPAALNSAWPLPRTGARLRRHRDERHGHQHHRNHQNWRQAEVEPVENSIDNHGMSEQQRDRAQP